MKKTLILIPLFAYALLLSACAGGPKPLRDVPEGKKKILLVENFRNNSVDGKKWNPWSLGLASMIQEDLLAVGYFKIVSAEARVKALKEIAFTRSGLTQGEALRIGKLLGAQWILVGDYTVVGENMNINIKVIDASSSRLLASTRGEGGVKSFFKLAKNQSLNLMRKFRFDLNAQEIGILKRRVGTRNVTASLENFSGEGLLEQIRFLELQKKKPGANRSAIEARIERLRDEARRRFQYAVKEDPNYERAKNNLNKMALMLPSSI